MAAPPAATGTARRGDRFPAPLFFVVGGISQYLGAALAVDLFDRLPPSAVAWLRVAFSALVLWLWRARTSIRRRRHVTANRRRIAVTCAENAPPDGTSSRPSGPSSGWGSWPADVRRAVVVFGTALAGMNLCFYLAVARLPLGTAVAIEFSGPIVVAALGVRRLRSVVALALAVGGVLLLADVQWQASPLGVLAALGAATLWAVYILVGRRVALSVSGLDGLTWSLLVGALAISPFGVVGLATGRPNAAVVVGCALVGVLSNVVPYSLDQLVLPRLRPSQFALLLSLLPATATLVGALLLGQRPVPAEFVGIAAVVAAVVVGSR
jgi:inner membrane transporter RhtA